MLAPGAGHRGASGLISVQVIRQTGGDIQAGTRCNRRRQTEWEWGGGEGAGIVGPLYTRRRGFVLPGDPCCAGQACQGQITDAGGWMYVRTKMTE